MPHAGTAVHTFQYVDPKNSTTTPLAAGATYTGAWVETLQFPTTTIAIATDKHCAFSIQFSPDATNVDSTVSFDFHPESVEPPKRLVNARRFYRIVATNNEATDMTYLRLQTTLGHHQVMNAPLNAIIHQDCDAVVTRNTNFEDEVATGHYEKTYLWQKFGHNEDIDTATLPEDIWTGGGTYTGFPTGAAEEFEIILSDAADIGLDITFYYLESTTSTIYKTATITTTALATSTGITGIRSPRAIVDTGGVAPNVGTVTFRHATTTANVFWAIEIGIGQTHVACFTVPYANKAIIRNLEVSVDKNNTAVITGGLWVRQDGSSPVIVNPGSASNSSQYQSRPFGGAMIEGFADIAMRVTACSANNTSVSGAMSIVLIDED